MNCIKDKKGKYDLKIFDQEGVLGWIHPSVNSSPINSKKGIGHPTFEWNMSLLKIFALIMEEAFKNM